jgi:hypothetical protein
MTTLTLLTKINEDKQLNQVSRALNLAFEGLKVDAKVLGVVAGGWVQIALSGEDEGVATNYVIKEAGLCPSNFESVKKFSTLTGYVEKMGKNREELAVDVGVFQPKTIYATIPLRRLQDQLVDGRKIALKKIAELFGLDEGSPVSVKVVDPNAEENRISAELSSKQIKKYGVWRESLLDRLLVLGASLPEVEAALERAKLKRDVIGVETLGLLEHALTCKLGTDAAGLIPKIGRTLRNARFSVFNPKEVMNFLNIPK